MGLFPLKSVFQHTCSRSLINSVLPVKRPLRRAKPRHALDCSGPFQATSPNKRGKTLTEQRREFKDGAAEYRGPLHLLSSDVARQMLTVRRTLEGCPRQVLHLKATILLGSGAQAHGLFEPAAARP